MKIPIPILELDNVTVSFDGFKALNNLNFSMAAGELRTIIGPNGAGKTTFLDVISGKVQPTTGRVLFNGRNLKSLKEHEIARLGIGRKFQTPRVYQNLNVRENLALSCFPKKNVFSSLLLPTTSAERRTVGGLLETIGLEAKADLAAALLSHGEKQRLEIGMLVAQSPTLLLVDEPAAGLTDEETENLGNLLISLADSHSLVVIEHDMEFVRQIARTVTVLHEGSLLCQGTMAEVQTNPRVIEVYLGKAPSLETRELLVLRIAATMAWADGEFEIEELTTVLTRLGDEFARDAAHKSQLQEELKDYLARTIPLEELVSELGDRAEREQVLCLAYEIIRVNGINEQEAMNYQKLVQLLDLPQDVVDRVKADVEVQYRHDAN